MSDEWCAQTKRDLAPLRDFRQRAIDLYPDTVAAVSRIVVAVNAAGNKAVQEGHHSVWAGESAQRLWSSAYDELLDFLRPDKNGRPQMLKGNDLTRLSKIALKLLEVAARLYAEVVPAVIGAADQGERLKIELQFKLHELTLNAVITPQVVAAHGGYVVQAAECLEHGWECSGEAEKLVPVMKMISRFVGELCRVSNEYTPGANPYSALMAEQFEIDCKDTHRLTAC